MENYYLIYAALGLGSIALLVFLVMSFSTWRVVHLLALFCVFCAGCTFMFYAAMVAKTRIAWAQRYQEYVKELKDEEKRGQELIHGELVATAGAKEPNLSELKVEIDRWLYDRGRVWRNSFPSNDPDNLVVQTSRPADGEEAAVNGISPGTILYAFSEKDAEGFRVPRRYIGKFRATAATDTTVSLAPLGELTNQQKAEIRTPPAGTSWVLYETMPQDGRHIYEQEDGLDEAAVMNYFPPKAQMAAVIPKSIFPKDLSGDTPQDISDDEYNKALGKIYEQLQIDFLYDGKPVTDIQQKFPDFAPKPENVYMEIKFKNLTKPEKIAVGSVEDLSATKLDALPQDSYDRAYFGPEGKAILASLKQVGGDTEFNNGDTIIFDRDTAQSYIDQDKADIINRYYFRPLRDFDYYFDNLVAQGEDLDESMKDIRERTAAVNEALQKLYGDDPKTPTAQIGARTDEVDKLNEDLQHFTHEVTELKKYREALQARTDKLSAAIENTKTVTANYEDQLETIQLKLKAEIDARTRAATAREL